MKQGDGHHHCKRASLHLPYSEEQYTEAAKGRELDTEATATSQPTTQPYCMKCMRRFPTREAFNCHKAGRPDAEGHAEPPEAHGMMSGAGAAYDMYTRSVVAAGTVNIATMSQNMANSTTAEMVTHAACLQKVCETISTGFELVVVADNMSVVCGVEAAEEPASARATCKKSAPAATMLVRQQATALRGSS